MLTDHPNCFWLTQCMFRVAVTASAAARDLTRCVRHIAEVSHLLALQQWAACVQNCVKHVTGSFPTMT